MKKVLVMYDHYFVVFCHETTLEHAIYNSTIEACAIIVSDDLSVTTEQLRERQLKFFVDVCQESENDNYRYYYEIRETDDDYQQTVDSFKEELDDMNMSNYIMYLM